MDTTSVDRMETEAASNLDLEACQSLQREEWEVVKSIYPDYVTGDLSKSSLILEVPIELTDPQTIVVTDDGSDTSADEGPSSNSTTLGEIYLTLSTLPPLVLHVCLPQDYPIRSAPAIVLFSATGSWLDPLCLDYLGELLIDIWRTGEGLGVLYDWIEFLRSGEFLTALGLRESDTTVRLPSSVPHLSAPILVDHDKAIKDIRFSESSYACSICLSACKGSRCLRLSCLHVFCQPCLGEFWRLCIAEGDIRKVSCPDPACLTACVEAKTEEVSRVLTEDEIKRWVWLREKRMLEIDPTIVYCPLLFCQTPIPKPITKETEAVQLEDQDATSSEDPKGLDLLRTCHNCRFSFCVLCGKTWHGTVFDCQLPQDTTGSKVTPKKPKAKRRVWREQQYPIVPIRDPFKEAPTAQKYIKWFTVLCPGCKVPIERSAGCNHMVCSRCNQNFCWTCGGKLDQNYSHSKRCKK